MRDFVCVVCFGVLASAAAAGQLSASSRDSVSANRTFDQIKVILGNRSLSPSQRVQRLKALPRNAVITAKDPNSIDTVLEFAIAADAGLEVIKYLVEEGHSLEVDPELVPRKWNLIERCSFLTNSTAKQSLKYFLSLSQSPHIPSVRWSWSSPLAAAIEGSNPFAVQTLLEWGADPFFIVANVPHRNGRFSGWTLAHFVGDLNANANLSAAAECIKILKAKGVSFKEKNAFGKTPLDLFRQQRPGRLSPAERELARMLGS